MLSHYKSKFKTIIHAVALPFLRVPPNIISLIGLMPCILCFIAVSNQYYVLGLIFLCLSVFDLIDGEVARSQGKTSTFGEFLDSSLDRISDILFIAGFGVAGVVKWEIIMLLITTSMMISYLRAKAELAASMVGHFSKFDVGILERPERILGIVITLFIFIFNTEARFSEFNLSIMELGFLVLIIFSIITMFQRILEANKRLNKAIDQGLDVSNVVGGEVGILRQKLIKALTKKLSPSLDSLNKLKSTRNKLRDKSRVVKGTTIND